jgi:hypothetical protein
MPPIRSYEASSKLPNFAAVPYRRSWHVADKLEVRFHGSFHRKRTSGPLRLSLQAFARPSELPARLAGREIDKWELFRLDLDSHEPTPLAAVSQSTTKRKMPRNQIEIARIATALDSARAPSRTRALALS